MTSIDIVHALSALRPGAEWGCNDDLSTLVWFDAVQTRPTDEEINAAIVAYIPPATVPGLQDQIAALQTQMASLIAAQQVK